MKLRDCINCDDTIIDRVDDFCCDECEEMYKEIEGENEDE